MYNTLLLLKVLLILFLTTNVYAALPPTRILDEGVDKGVFFKLDCVGAGIACTQSGITGTLSVSGGGAGLAEGDIDTSAELDAIINDNTGSGMIVFNDTAIMTSLTVNTALTLGAAGILSDNSIDSDDFVHEDWGEVTNASGSVVIDDSVTVTGWVMGASSATTPAEGDNDTSLATTAYVIAETADILDGTDAFTDMGGTDFIDNTHIEWGTGAGQVGTADIGVDTDKNFVTDAQLTVIGNTSGANTGDNDEVGTKNTGDMCTNDGSDVQCTVNTEAEFETAMDGLNFLLNTEVSSSADLAGLLSDEDKTGDCGADKFCVGGHTHSSYLSSETNDLETSDPPNVETTEIYIGTGSGTGAWAAMSTDATMANDGTVTVVDDSHAHVVGNIDSAASATWAGQISDEDNSGLCAANVFCMGGHEHAGASLTDNTEDQSTGCEEDKFLQADDSGGWECADAGGGEDDQTIDVLSFSDPNLSVSLEDDGEATQTVDISGLNIDPDNLDDEDQGDVDIDSDTWKVQEVQSGAISEAADIDNDIITNAQIADADQTDTKCFKYIESDGIDDADDFVSVWHNGTANAFLITSFWCETDADTVTGMLQVDDGAPADIEAVDIVCDDDEQQELAPDGDCEIAAGEELDWVTVSQTGSTVLTVCWTGNWVD